jgi:hypothetical protein
VAEDADALVPERSTYWLTRLVFLRLLGAIYLVAFVSLWWQLLPLLGAHGILPAHLYLERVRASLGPEHTPFVELPTIFWLGCSDGALRAGCALGLALSLAVVGGLANSLVLLVLWFLYMSFVHIGQTFYSFGWEILLLEAGFLAIFFCRPLGRSALDAAAPPPTVVVWLVRWLLFRVMFGAGLIKLRGDECWRDLTCLVYHYETQPLPNPLSWLAHQASPWFHKLGVLFNHLVELIAPWGMFGPRRFALIAGLLQASFQLTLILSGNLSWLNWLTLALCVACFDDRALARVVPAGLRARVAALGAPSLSWPARVTSGVLVAAVAVLSIDPIGNLFSSRQLMNFSFDRLHLVNTYGAFGSIGKTRDEVILEGTYDAQLDDKTHWQEYEFPCKPGSVTRRPCVIAPFQLRLDWQIWFAAMSTYDRQPWLVHLVYQLLEGDPGALSLLADGPFTHAPPPRYIRATLYEYHFTRFGERGWWTRRPRGEYLPPLSRDDPSLLEFVQRHGWLDDDAGD